jgi:hypothetical protein
VSQATYRALRRTVDGSREEGASVMWFYAPAAVLLVLFAVWFSRTNIVRHHRSGKGKDPGQNGTYKAM